MAKTNKVTKRLGARKAEALLRFATQFPEAEVQLKRVRVVLPAVD